MVKREFTFPSADGKTAIHAVEWLPEGAPRAVLQIAHGVSEYVLRYEDFAGYLTERGFAVVGNDHLGHGLSVSDGAPRLYFGPKGSWNWVVEDMEQLRKLTHRQFPNLPYFLLGHSMGSFLTRTYLIRYPGTVDGAIIMGTGYQPKALVQLARTICRVLAVFHGWHYRSKLVARLSFLGYNKGLEGRTAHDWLNRDPVEVDRYRADERCTFIFTLNAYYSMFSGILRLYDPALLARVPKDLPMLFLAGDADPVGEQGAGVKRAVKSLLDAGVKNIEVKLYPSARHELLVELNREEVFADIGDWLERRL